MARLLSIPRDLTWDELATFLGYLGFEALEGAGSRVKFIHADGTLISLHRPHPGNNLKRYQIKLVIEILRLN